jgi:hypothetical protein
MILFEYRILRKKYIDKDAEIKYNYFIGELYYTHEGELDYFTLTPQPPCGETISGLQRDFINMLDAFSKPILDYDALVLQIRKTSIIHPTHTITDKFMANDEKRKMEELRYINEMQGKNVFEILKCMLTNYKEYLKSTGYSIEDDNYNQNS